MFLDIRSIARYPASLRDAVEFSLPGMVIFYWTNML